MEKVKLESLAVPKPVSPPTTRDQMAFLNYCFLAGVPPENARMMLAQDAMPTYVPEPTAPAPFTYPPVAEDLVPQLPPPAALPSSIPASA
eukprot:1218231-Karenia_brevis.AAC.1